MYRLYTKKQSVVNMIKNKIKKLNSVLLIGIIFLMVLVFSSVIYAGWVQNGTDYMYYNDTNGNYVINNWIQTSDGYYYMNGQGRLTRGWARIGNDYYYFNDNGLMQTGFVSAGGYNYYLNTDGKMVIGWLEMVTNGQATYYYLDTNGQMVNGWKQMDNNWYYFNDYKCIVNAWANINNAWYKFNVKGQMVTGWYMQDNKYYYLSQSSGQMQTGWLQDTNGYRYFLSKEDGHMLQNQTAIIDGVQYTFNASGQLVNQDNTAQNLTNQSNFTGSGVNIGISPGSTNANVNAVSSSITQATNKTNKDTVVAGSTIGPS